MSETFDAVVVGAGPAGMAAATKLAKHGASTLVLDEQPAPGGQIYRGAESVARAMPALLESLGPDYAHGQALIEVFRASGAGYRPGSIVWQVDRAQPDAPLEIWVSRNGASETITARTLIVATGAMERPVPVPGWTLPGVMGAGAVQVLLKSSGLLPDGLVLAGAGPLVLLLAAQCLAAGATISAVLDTTPKGNLRAALPFLPAALRGTGPSYLWKGLALKAALKRVGVRTFRHVSDIVLTGDRELAGLTFRSEGKEISLPATLVALHEGVIPAQQMTRMLGCDHAWDKVQHCFRPVVDSLGWSSVPGVLVAGDGAGIGGARAAEPSGRLAALAALHRVGRIDAATRDELAAAERKTLAAHRAIRPFLDRLFAPPAWVTRPADDVVICRCEEVTAGAVREAARAGAQGPNQTKAFLRAGMGPCQGRICGPLVSEIMARMHGAEVAASGYYRIRPPLKPVTLGELAGGELAGGKLAGGDLAGPS